MLSPPAVFAPAPFASAAASGHARARARFGPFLQHPLLTFCARRAPRPPPLPSPAAGHPARWGEQTDGTNIYQFTCPALMGAAEVLWSPYNTTADGSISRSLSWRVIRCMLVRRGVPVDPRSGGGNSCEYEWEPAYPPLTLLAPNPANSSWANRTY